MFYAVRRFGSASTPKDKKFFDHMHSHSFTACHLSGESGSWTWQSCRCDHTLSCSKGYDHSEIPCLLPENMALVTNQIRHVVFFKNISCIPKTLSAKPSDLGNVLKLFGFSRMEWILKTIIKNMFIIAELLFSTHIVTCLNVF